MRKKIWILTIAAILSLGCTASIAIKSFEIESKFSIEEWAQKPVLNHILDLTGGDPPKDPVKDEEEVVPE